MQSFRQNGKISFRRFNIYIYIYIYRVADLSEDIEIFRELCTESKKAWNESCSTRRGASSNNEIDPLPRPLGVGWGEHIKT